MFKKGDRIVVIPQTIAQSGLHLAICCKEMEHILCHSIMKHLELYHILNNLQYGFRSGHSCQVQLISIVKEIQYSLDHHYHVDLIMLDFCKTFDTVAHTVYCFLFVVKKFRGCKSFPSFPEKYSRLCRSA